MDVTPSQIVDLHDAALARWADSAVECSDGLQAAECQAAPPRASAAEAGEFPGGSAPAGSTSQAPAAATAPAALLEHIEAAHFANRMIWRLEDEARRRDVGDARIADVKRAIDPWNQRRNDLMEEIDAAILVHYANVDVSGAELHSETAGMMIDRLSILALKIRNMDAVAADAAADGDAALAGECDEKAGVLRTQRSDLVGCLARLFEDFAAGRRRFRTYRQMKSYNDERLNPVLRETAKAASRRGADEGRGTQDENSEERGKVTGR